jgi:hypothetical protein
MYESNEDLCEKVIKKINNNPFCNLDEVTANVTVPNQTISLDS